eukprot:scaffold27123_cov33-Phaeocystis_antarctica.AAC.1
MHLARRRHLRLLRRRPRTLPRRLRLSHSRLGRLRARGVRARARIRIWVWVRVWAGVRARAR